MPRYIVHVVRGATVVAVENDMDVLAHGGARQTAIGLVARLALAAERGGPDYRGAVLEVVSEDRRCTFCVPFPPLLEVCSRTRRAVAAVYGTA